MVLERTSARTHKNAHACTEVKLLRFKDKQIGEYSGGRGGGGQKVLGVARVHIS